MDQGEDVKIGVAVRFRPFIPREVLKNASSQWCIIDNSVSALQTHFCTAYEKIFGMDNTNADVYNYVRPIVASAVSGTNGTILAYGQTASGKTHTMYNIDSEDAGIIPRAAKDLYDIIENEVDVFLIKVSFVELFNEQVRDLLAPETQQKMLKIKENMFGKMNVHGLTEEIVQSVDDIYDALRRGDALRRKGETHMNNKSSRSHTIFRIIVESSKRIDDSGDGANRFRSLADLMVRVSQLNLVDLAGSEDAKQTGPSSDRLYEAGFINRSLHSLTNVIHQLSEKADVVSYRDSKLTRILKNSLERDAKIAIVCHCTAANYDETLATLQFAKIVKSIKNNKLMSADAPYKSFQSSPSMAPNLAQCSEASAEAPDAGEASPLIYSSWFRKVISIMPAELEISTDTIEETEGLDEFEENPGNVTVAPLSLQQTNIIDVTWQGEEMDIRMNEASCQTEGSKAKEASCQTEVDEQAQFDLKMESGDFSIYSCRCRVSEFELGAMEAQVQLLHNELQKRDSALCEKDDEITILNTTLNTMRCTTRRDLQYKLLLTENKLEKLKTANDATEETNRRLELLVHQLTVDLEEKSAELKRFQRSMAEKMKQLEEDLEKKCAEMEELVQFTQLAENLKNTSFKERKAKLDQTKAELEILKKTCKTTEETNRSLDKDINKLKASFQEKCAELERIKGEKDELIKHHIEEVAFLKKCCAEGDKELDMCQQELGICQQELQSIEAAGQTDQPDLRDIIDEKDELIRHYEAEVVYLKKYCDDTETELDLCQQELNKCQQELGMCQQELDQCQQELQSMKDADEIFQSDYQDIEGVKEERDKLYTEVGTLHLDNVKLQMRLVKTTELLQEKIQRLQKLLADMKEEKNSLIHRLYMICQPSKSSAADSGFPKPAGGTVEEENQASLQSAEKKIIELQKEKEALELSLQKSKSRELQLVDKVMSQKLKLEKLGAQLFSKEVDEQERKVLTNIGNTPRKSRHRRHTGSSNSSTDSSTTPSAKRPSAKQPVPQTTPGVQHFRRVLLKQPVFEPVPSKKPLLAFEPAAATAQPAVAFHAAGTQGKKP